MRLLVLLLVLAASAASAQPEVPRSMGTGQSVVAFYGDHSGGAVGAFAVRWLTAQLGASSDAALVTGIVVYPLATAAATYGIGQAFGADGTPLGMLAGAAVGTGVGVGLGLLVAQSADGAGGPPEDFEDLFEALAGGLNVLLAVAVPYVLGPTLGAVIGFNVSVQPSAAIRPDERRCRRGRTASAWGRRA